MHKVFIIERFEIEDDGKNVSQKIGLDAIFGLAPSKDTDVNHESYGEYLQRRKLIANNTLGIVMLNSTDTSFHLEYTFDEFNSSAIHTKLFKRSQGSKNAVWIGSVAGFSFDN